MKDYDQSLSVLVLTSSLPGEHSKNRVLNTMGSLYMLKGGLRKEEVLEKRKVPQDYDKETVDIFYSQES